MEKPSKEEADEEKKKIKYEQEKIALEQEKIRKAQAELEEEKKKLREAQAKLESEKQQQVDVIQNKEETQYVPPVQTLSYEFRKMVVFVGANKAGTSFVVNNLAEFLSSMNLKTAILDVTKSKNAYYIYTNNDDKLRATATSCMKNLENGIAEGITVNKNSVPFDTEKPTITS